MRHLPVSGSKFFRLSHCPRSSKLSENVSPMPESTAAARGTLLHTVIETVVKTRSWDGIEDLECNDAADVRSAYQALEQLYDQYDVDPDSVKTEVFAEISPGVAGGYTDLFAMSRDRKKVIVVDYKFGYHPVPPDADQLLFNALCIDYASSDLMEEATTLVTVIIQPSNESRGGDVLQIQEWDYMDALDAFEERVHKLVKDLDKPTPTIESGPWCRFCPAQEICPLKTGDALSALKMKPDQLTDLTAALQLAEQLEPWIKAVKNRAHNQLECGDKIPGYKLVAKRATKKWTDLIGLRNAIKRQRGISVKEAYIESPLTPAQLLKLCKSKELDTEFIKPYFSDVSSGTTLVKENDKRPAAPAIKALAALN